MVKMKNVLAMLMAMIMATSISTIAYSDEYVIKGADGQTYSTWGEFAESLRSIGITLDKKYVGSLTSTNKSMQVSVPKGSQLAFGAETDDFSTTVYYNGELYNTFEGGFTMTYTANKKKAIVTLKLEKGTLYVFDDEYLASINSKTTSDKSTSKYIDDFNPEFYAAANPDVVKAIGKDPDALYKHYMNFGKAEGRKPHA